MSDNDYRIYAAISLSYIYVVHLLIVALLTDSPRAPLARFVNWLWSGTSTGVPNSSAIIPARTREMWRGPMTIALLALWGADLFVIFAGDKLGMVARRAHVRDC